MSSWFIAAKAEIRAVKRPRLIIVILPISENCKSGEILTSINTPAVTIVAAWINALAGVGPSIASGNQLNKGNWADFPKAPKSKNKIMRSKFSGRVFRVFSNILKKLKVSK